MIELPASNLRGIGSSVLTESPTDLQSTELALLAESALFVLSTTDSAYVPKSRQSGCKADSPSLITSTVDPIAMCTYCGLVLAILAVLNLFLGDSLITGELLPVSLLLLSVCLPVPNA